MYGKRPDWNNEHILEAAKKITNKYYIGEIKNRWCLEIEFYKATGYRLRYSTIMNHAYKNSIAAETSI